MKKKEWFKRGGLGGASNRGHSIDELIVLERYPEAEERLRQRLKGHDDVHARLKLAEVLTHQRRGHDAVEEYVRVADQYSRDGFQDKAAAALRKALKLDPHNDGLRVRQERIGQAKQLERTRQAAVNALKEASRSRTGHMATAVIELEQIWDRLARTDFVTQLNADQIPRVLGNMEIMRAAPGTRLAARGDSTPALFVISGGEIAATIPSPNGPVTLRTFTSGQVIGESTLLEHRNWMADYTAVTPSSVLKLTREGLEATLVGNPDPRALLDGLRQQRNDSDLSDSIRKLGQVS